MEIVCEPVLQLKNFKFSNRLDVELFSLRPIGAVKTHKRRYAAILTCPKGIRTFPGYFSFVENDDFEKMAIRMMKDWNAAYENGETPWDKGEAAPPLAEYLKRRSARGKVLVPGCGVGHDVRLLAGQGADVLGLDVAEAAVRKAERFQPIAGERYHTGDFLDLPEIWKERFDCVFEHTCLCALEPSWRKR